VGHPQDVARPGHPRPDGLRSLSWLAWLLPVGFLLKWVGCPLLAVLAVLAAPVLLLLLLIGLPIFVVLLFGGALLSFVGWCSPWESRSRRCSSLLVLRSIGRSRRPAAAPSASAAESAAV
jgi:hypothetical protein